MVARATKEFRVEAKHIVAVMGDLRRAVAASRRPEAEVNLFMDEALALIDKGQGVEAKSSLDCSEGKVSVLIVTPSSALLKLIDDFKAVA